MSDPDSYTTPTPNPSEESSIATPMRPEFAFDKAPKPSEPIRLHPDMTRHPTTAKWTKSPANRSK